MRAKALNECPINEMNPVVRDGFLTTDLDPGDVGPNGFPVAYNRQGDKVELWGNYDGLGNTADIVLRRSDNTIWTVIDKLTDRVWYSRAQEYLANVKQGVESPLSKEQLKAVHQAVKVVESRNDERTRMFWAWFEAELPDIYAGLAALRWVMREQWKISDPWDPENCSAPACHAPRR